MSHRQILAHDELKDWRMAAFATGETRWIELLGNLRNTIRQEVIRRQLADYATAGMTVLDVGCGQGTQAIQLAKLGCVVTGLEPSDDLRARCAVAASEAGVEIELLTGSLEQSTAPLRDRRFDLVCAHGLLMYLPDRGVGIGQLSALAQPGGLLSITFRNAHALAMRPALRRDWAGALAAFDNDAYLNGIGVTARADRLEDVTADLDRCTMTVDAWFGVRVFNDAVPGSMEVPVDEDIAALLDAEDLAGRRDPYRWMASQFHVMARSSLT
jgi:S-adenosylmethionine-dependent methyltransferase